MDFTAVLPFELSICIFEYALLIMLRVPVSASRIYFFFFSINNNNNIGGGLGI